MTATIRIVIVNYRSAGLTIDCLASLEPEVAAYPGPVRAVVVENASGDGSADRLAAELSRRGWSSWAELMPLDRNGGFASGNNAAIAPALGGPDRPDYVWLLNPDTVVRPGALAELVGFLEAHPAAGLAGSRLEDPDGTPQRSAFRFPCPLSELEDGLRFGPASRLLRRWIVAPPVPAGPEPSPTDWVAGASLMVRRAVFEAIGLLDERYFMYFEEVDFCRRAAKAGWPCWYVPRSRVVHLVGQSSGVTAKATARRRRPAYWFASRGRYFRAHFGPLGKLISDLLWAGGFGAYRLRRIVHRRDDACPDRLLSDFLRYNFLSRPEPR